jgi:hypothetical protein
MKGGSQQGGGWGGEDSTAALACFLGLAVIMSFWSSVSDTLMPSKSDTNFLVCVCVRALARECMYRQTPTTTQKQKQTQTQTQT